MAARSFLFFCILYGGEKMQKKKRVAHVNFMLTPEERRAVDRLAAEQRSTLSQVVRQAIFAHLERAGVQIGGGL